MNGLRTKLECLKNNLSLLVPKPDIILLTETYLHPNLLDSELGFIGYNVFRRDREVICGFSGYGGGVLIAISDSIPVRVCDLLHPDLEHLFITVNHWSYKLLIGVSYFPPRSPSDSYARHTLEVDNLIRSFDDHEILLFGDYNLPQVSWTSPPPHLCNHPDLLIRDSVKIIDDFATLHALQQYYPDNTLKNYTLDVAFSSSVNLLHLESSDHLVPQDIHHDSAFFTLSHSYFRSIDFQSLQWDFRNVDYDSLSVSLATIDWNSHLSHVNVDSNVSELYNVIYTIIQKHVPSRRLFSSTFPIWFSHELKSLISDKKIAHKKWRSFNLQSDYIEFKRLRAVCIRLSRTCYRNYIAKVEASSVNDCKSFWSYVKTLKSSNNLPASMSLGDQHVTTLKEISDLFARHFSSVYIMSSNHNPSQSDQNDHTAIQDMLISESDILRASQNLKSSFSFGPDLLPTSFVKNCISTLLYPLGVLFNKSIQEGHLPKFWKQSFVTPVFKSGNKSSISQYRPISIISAFPKLLDAIIAEKFSEVFSSVIIDEQHGFVKGRSTSSNLLLYSNYISRAIECSRQVDSICLDFSKAFDTIDHGLLLNKLSSIGVKGNVFRWIASYLNGREQSVRIKGTTSTNFVTTSGVPQGSHLGPILFILFINDITESIPFGKTLIYADDVKLFSVINSPCDGSKLQRSLDAVTIWSHENRLQLNISKCTSISFYRGSNPLKFVYCIGAHQLASVSSVKDLGVLFDSSFKFTSHLQAVTSKAFATLGFLMRSTKDFTNVQTIRYLYQSIVLPNLLYCSIIWSPHTAQNISVLESVQRRFIRYISYKAGDPMRAIDHDYSTRSNRFYLPTIKSIHHSSDVITTFKIIRGIIVCSELSDLFESRVLSYDLRRARAIAEDVNRSNYGFESAIARLRREFNLLPNCITILSFNEFRSEAKRFTMRFY